MVHRSLFEIIDRSHRQRGRAVGGRSGIAAIGGFAAHCLETTIVGPVVRILQVDRVPRE